MNKKRMAAVLKLSSVSRQSQVMPQITFNTKLKKIINTSVWSTNQDTGEGNLIAATAYQYSTRAKTNLWPQNKIRVQMKDSLEATK